MSGEGPEPDNPDPAMDDLVKAAGRKRKDLSDVAFDLWLDRGLRAMYDGVAEEPIPADLLALIERHRDGA